MEVFVAQAGSHRALNNQQCDRRIFNSSTSSRREASKIAQGNPEQSEGAPLGLRPASNLPPHRARIEPYRSADPVHAISLGPQAARGSASHPLDYTTLRTLPAVFRIH